MPDLTFLSPLRLWLLVLPVVIAGVYVVQQIRRRGYVLRFSDLSLFDDVAPDKPGWRRHLPAARRRPRARDDRARVRPPRGRRGTRQAGRRRRARARHVAVDGGHRRLPVPDRRRSRCRERIPRRGPRRRSCRARQLRRERACPRAPGRGCRGGTARAFEPRTRRRHRDRRRLVREPRRDRRCRSRRR